MVVDPGRDNAGSGQTWPMWLWPTVEQILERHFAARGRPLVSGGGKSISAVMIERCMLMGYRSIVCGDCDGSGIGDESPRGAPDCRGCNGTGQVSWTEGDKCELPAAVCETCNGSGRYWRKRCLVFAPRVPYTSGGKTLLDYRGRIRWKKPRIVGSYINDTPKVEGIMAWCVQCSGTGRRDGLSVIPGTETPSAPAQPDDTGAGGNAVASSVLRRLAESLPAACTALSLLYGEEGQHAVASGLGRGFAILPATEHGGFVARNGAGVSSYGRLINALRSEKSGTIDDLTSRRLTLARVEGSAIEASARTALFRADTQCGGGLMRQALREAT